MIPGHPRSAGDHEDEVPTVPSSRLKNHHSALGHSFYVCLSLAMFGIPALLCGVDIVRALWTSHPVDKAAVLFGGFCVLGLVWSLCSVRKPSDG